MAKMEFKYPRVPFTANIAGGLAPGKEIFVKGKSNFQFDPNRRFCINLGVDPQYRENIALHIGPSLNENAIVLTTLKMGIWATGQRTTLSFIDKFEFHIKLEQDRFRISLNGQHIGDVHYQFPPHMVNHIDVEGGCELKLINIEGYPMPATTYPTQLMYPPAPMYQQPAPVYIQPQPYVVAQPQVVVVEDNHRSGPSAGGMMAGMVMGAAIADMRRPHVAVVGRRGFRRW